MKLTLLDQLKIRTIIFVRYINFRAIEKWSRNTFQTRRKSSSPALALEKAQTHYQSPGIPDLLQVPVKIPKESKLSFSYKLPYYYLTGALFKLYLKLPIRKGIKWLPGFKFNKAFPINKEGWKNTNSDEEFGLLRLQGPNPFLLRHTSANEFEVDYTPFFRNIHEPVKCLFQLEGTQLIPTSIQIGDHINTPGSENWERAKLIANALDARYCVFTRHLLDTHLLIGEAYAIATFSLKVDHPLRAFFNVFTFGSLVVNDYAYKLLITPASYFIQSGFISAQDAMTLFQNSMDVFTLDDLVVPQDIKKRGLNKIPAHPYVEDAQKVWSIFQSFVAEYTKQHYPTDESIIADENLQEWYAKLASLLPNQDITDKPLNTKQQLTNVICCLLYNNVSHEVCGDFSVYGQTANPEHKKIVNFERIKQGDLDTDPDVADVFLFDQGAFAGRFNNGGNNMLTLPIDQLVHDEHLHKCVKRFQANLRQLDQELETINKQRKIPFLRMMPRKWEASISF